MVGTPPPQPRATKVRAVKTVYVRRAAQPPPADRFAGGSQPSLFAGVGDTTAGGGQKKVILARRLGAGDTIKLVDTPAKVSAPDPFEEALETVPQSMVSPSKGPKTDPRSGATMEHSVLGSAAEFDAMITSKNAGLDTSADFEEELSAAEGESLLAEYREKQDLARTKESELQQLKDSKTQQFNSGEVSKRKALIHEKMAMGKQERALAKWEKQCAVWDTFKLRMARQLGSTLDELVFSRAEEYREMLEDFQLMMKAIPAKEQHGPNTWEMSLRDAWTKYVPVGNSLSGLFCPVSMKPDDQIGNFSKVRPNASAAHGHSGCNPPQPVRFLACLCESDCERYSRNLSNDGQVRNPEGVRMRMAATEIKKASGRHFMADTKSWRDGEPYKAKMHKFKKQLQEIWPHEPLFGDLEVTGYRPGTAMGGRGTDDWGATDTIPEETAGSMGSAGGVGALAGPEGGSSVVPEAPSGPKLHFETSRVLLECTCGKLSSSTLTARNSGSTALYYTWRKIEKPNVLRKNIDGIQRFFFAGKPVCHPGFLHHLHSVTWQCCSSVCCCAAGHRAAGEQCHF